MSGKDRYLLTITANEQICRYFDEKKKEGYNVSALLRKIIEEYMKKEEESKR